MLLIALGLLLAPSRSRDDHRRRNLAVLSLLPSGARSDGRRVNYGENAILPRNQDVYGWLCHAHIRRTVTRR